MRKSLVKKKLGWERAWLRKSLDCEIFYEESHVQKISGRYFLCVPAIAWYLLSDRALWVSLLCGLGDLFVVLLLWLRKPWVGKASAAWVGRVCPLTDALGKEVRHEHPALLVCRLLGLLFECL